MRDDTRRWVRVGEASQLLGIHRQTLRTWEEQGRLTARRLGNRRDRLFDRLEIESLVSGITRQPRRQAALYVRVSGSTGQESSLVAQERELREAVGEGAEVSLFSDKASGLNERRRGLKRLRVRAAKGEFSEVWVTHEDRLARFGVDFLRAELAGRGTVLHVLHEREDASPEQELLDDFMNLLASFSGRVYGQRSATAKKRLVEATGAGGGRGGNK